MKDPSYFAEVFNTIQDLIEKEKILSGHDISAGGMITTLLEMCFSNTEGGAAVNLSAINERDIVKILLSQNPGIIIQVRDVNEIAEILLEHGISYYSIGHPITERTIKVTASNGIYNFDIDRFRDLWFHTSYLLDKRQSGNDHARERYQNYKHHALNIKTGNFQGTFKSLGNISRTEEKMGNTGRHYKGERRQRRQGDGICIMACRI